MRCPIEKGRKISFLCYGCATSAGCVREINEDYAGCYQTDTDTLLVVADGMGGMGGGAVASRLTVEAIRDEFLRRPGDDPREVLRDAGNYADRVVVELAVAEPDLNRMGATVAAVIVRGEAVFVAHAGDARVYLVHGKEMSQLTRDHSTVQHLLDQGLIRPDDAVGHPLAHAVHLAIGHLHGQGIEVAPEPVQLSPGDALVLCSDGVTDLIDEHEIAEVIGALEPQAACDELLRLVLERGGRDNATLQVVRLEHEAANDQ